MSSWPPANHQDIVDKINGMATTTIPRLGIVRVASSQAPADVKAQCNYVCDGTNDQVEINLALKDASRPGDGFGGLGGGCVELVGGDFFTSQDDTTTITMYPATWLRGSGYGTMVQPRWATDQDRGAIELLNNNVAQVRISDMTIGRPLSVAHNGHSIKLYKAPTGSTYEVQTGQDAFCVIDNVICMKPNRSGVYLTGTGTGSARESQLVNVTVWDSGSLTNVAVANGFDLNSSDCKLTGCTVQTRNGHGFYFNGGNLKMANCKSYYSDNATRNGYEVSASRAELVGCAAQDNGLWGFNVSGSDVTMIGCVADSNGRLDNTNGGGFQISSAGVYADLHAFDRGNTVGSPQLRGIVISGSPQLYLTGRVSVPSGTNQVVGTPGTNSFARVVRNGTTLYSVG